VLCDVLLHACDDDDEREEVHCVLSVLTVAFIAPVSTAVAAAAAAALVLIAVLVAKALQLLLLLLLLLLTQLDLARCCYHVVCTVHALLKLSPLYC
jgi:hypothetical protein